jgi:hypothetical protein
MFRTGNFFQMKFLLGLSKKKAIHFPSGAKPIRHMCILILMQLEAFEHLQYLLKPPGTLRYARGGNFALNELSACHRSKGFSGNFIAGRSAAIPKYRSTSFQYF